jgi:hypothetical protein
VEYLIVGGYAVGFYGHPRYTKDLDIWINISKENAHNLMKALNDFGFGSLGLKENDFYEEGKFIQLGYPPNRLDIITFADGLTFNDVYSQRNQVDVEGIICNFIDLDNLIINKKSTGKNQDLADLDNLISK